MPKKKGKLKNIDMFARETQAEYLPSFASTADEIKIAVEHNAISRGTLLVKVIMALDVEGILNIVQGIPKRATYDPEDLYQNANELGININALDVLNSSNPPIPYAYYFSTPDWLIENPELFLYYRNVAMISRKVMNGIGLRTEAYEDYKQIPTGDDAREISKYLNEVISGLLITIGKVSLNMHLQMFLANLGDSLGGTSRNDVGRSASALIVKYIALHMHTKGVLESISYSIKEGFEVDDEEESQRNEGVYKAEITPDLDLASLLASLEKQRVKYKELRFTNGLSLLLDRQIKWTALSEDGNQISKKFGVDFHSTEDNSESMKWAAELKGGADPAGSDEHWKTATEALNRIIEASKETGRATPDLSFIATIFVERVAKAAQKWIDEGKLKSAYNLTKIQENEIYRNSFISEIEKFLNY
jgi:hypothetical protein